MRMILACALAAVACSDAPDLDSTASAIRPDQFTDVISDSQLLATGELCDFAVMDDFTEKHTIQIFFDETLEQFLGHHHYTNDGTLTNPANGKWAWYAAHGETTAENFVYDLDETGTGTITADLVGSGSQLRVWAPSAGILYDDAGHTVALIVRFFVNGRRVKSITSAPTFVAGTFDGGDFGAVCDFLQ